MVTRILLAEDDSDDRELFTSFYAGREDISIVGVVTNGLEPLVTASVLGNSASIAADKVIAANGLLTSRRRLLTRGLLTVRRRQPKTRRSGKGGWR